MKKEKNSIKSQLKQIQDILNEVSNADAEDIFFETIEKKLADFIVKEIGSWANGIIDIDREINRDLLLRLYQSANESIYATCAQEYISLFRVKKNRDNNPLLEAHRAEEQKRIFIFPSITSIRNSDITIIENQKKKKIDVKIYIEDQNEDDSVLGEGMVKDFLLIDGKILSEIFYYRDSSKHKTKWTFATNRTFKANYQRYSKAFKEMYERAEEFEDIKIKWEKSFFKRTLPD